MRDRVRVYRAVWSLVEETYFAKYMVSERGFQAALRQFLNIVPGINVVVEPTWTIDGKQMTPDLVIVEKGQITDIFELKFVPHHYPSLKDIQKDIRKLLRYGANRNEGYPVYLIPETGQWGEELPLHKDCRLHFVAVARHAWANSDVAAVWPQDLMAGVPELRENPGRLNHWFGRVGGDTAERREWSIEFGIR